MGNLKSSVPARLSRVPLKNEAAHFASRWSKKVFSRQAGFVQKSRGFCLRADQAAVRALCKSSLREDLCVSRELHAAFKHIKTRAVLVRFTAFASSAPAERTLSFTRTGSDLSLLLSVRWVWETIKRCYERCDCGDDAIPVPGSRS